MANIKYETEGDVAIITIDRPHVRNAVDGRAGAELADAFRRFEADDSLNVAILTGSEGAFCAGADLKAVADTRGNRVGRPETDGPMGLAHAAGEARDRRRRGPRRRRRP